MSLFLKILIRKVRINYEINYNRLLKQTNKKYQERILIKMTILHLMMVEIGIFNKLRVKNILIAPKYCVQLKEMNNLIKNMKVQEKKEMNANKLQIKREK